MFNLFPNLFSPKKRLEDIEKTINKFYKKHNFERDDNKAIKKDWEKVGKALSKYIR